MLETTTDINANDAAAVLQPINSWLGDFVDKVYKRGGQEGGAQRRRPEERRHMKAKEDDQRLLQAWTKMGDWLMSHPGYAFSVFLTRNIKTFTILLDHSSIDSEPCNLEE